MHLHYADLVVLVGLSLAVIMAVAFGIRAKKHIANIWLVCFLISSAIVLVVKFLYSTGSIINFPHWFKVNYPAGILRPVFIFLYVHYLLNGINRIRKIDSLHFTPFLLLIIYLFPFLVQSHDYKLAVLNREVVNTYGLIPPWFAYVQLLYSIFYVVGILVDLKCYIEKYDSPSKSQQSLIRWISFLVWGGIIYLMAAMILRLLGLTQNFNYYLYEIFSIGLVLLCIRLLTLPALVNMSPNNKYEKSRLSTNEIDKYFQMIHELMAETSFFRREDLKLKDIANELHLPEYLISQIINQKTGQSFRNFLNAYRIREAKEMLAKSRNQFSIEGIAKHVGFNSRASFYKAFRRETSLTPTEFLTSIK